MYAHHSSLFIWVPFLTRLWIIGSKVLRFAFGTGVMDKRPPRCIAPNTGVLFSEPRPRLPRRCPPT